MRRMSVALKPPDLVGFVVLFGVVLLSTPLGTFLFRTSDMARSLWSVGWTAFFVGDKSSFEEVFGNLY